MYEFGPYRLYRERRLLLRGQEAIPLSAKALEILVVLVQRRGEVVSKDDLMQAVWPNTFVEEANIGQNIFVVRRIHRKAGFYPFYKQIATARLLQG